MFCSKIDNFSLIANIFTGSVEQAYMHPHVEYLSDQMNLKFPHKLAYNY